MGDNNRDRIVDRLIEALDDDPMLALEGEIRRRLCIGIISDVDDDIMGKGLRIGCKIECDERGG
jgi:hypothetical protein